MQSLRAVEWRLAAPSVREARARQATGSLRGNAAATGHCSVGGPHAAGVPDAREGFYFHRGIVVLSCHTHPANSCKSRATRCFARSLKVLFSLWGATARRSHVEVVLHRVASSHTHKNREFACIQFTPHESEIEIPSLFFSV